MKFKFGAFFQIYFWNFFHGMFIFFLFVQENKAEIITRENKKRLIAKEEEKEEKRWKACSFSIEEEIKENFNSGMKNLEDFLKSCKSSSVKLRVEMVALTACLKAWKDHCRDKSM